MNCEKSCRCVHLDMNLNPCLISYCWIDYDVALHSMLIVVNVFLPHSCQNLFIKYI